jgi:hypothetical protein
MGWVAACRFDLVSFGGVPLGLADRALTLGAHSTVWEDMMSDPFDNSGDNGGPSTPPPFGGPPASSDPTSSDPTGSFGQAGSFGDALPPPTQPVYSNPEHTPVYGDTNLTELVATSASPKRSRGKMVGALVGVAALLGAGAFAVSKLSGDNSASGGAGSPAEVGDQLVKSLDGEDLLGIVDLLLPGERETFRQPLVDLNKELKRLEVTDSEVDLNKMPGIDITITDPTVRAQDTNVDDISTVNITGTATVAVNGKDLPIGQLLIDTAFGGDRPDVDENADERDFDVDLTTVKQDGHWYLSLGYSLAQQMAGGRDIPTDGVEPVGADSPEGALDNLVMAAGDLNLERMIASLNPNEASALQRYAPLFLDDAQSSLDDMDAKISISKAEYSVSGSGDRRQVGITAIKIDASAGDQDFSVELKDGCATVSSDGSSLATCSGDSGQDDSLQAYFDQLGFPNTPELMTLIDDARSAFGDFEMHGVVVDKVDGKWFVSPIGTGTEFLLSVLRALDRDEIDTLVNDGKAAFKSIIDAIFSGAFPPDDTDSTPTTFPEDSTVDTTFDTTSDTVNLDTTTFYFDCLNGQSNDEASACIQKGIEDGRFDQSTIPGPYQFPDCKLFDYYNGTDLYTDSPEEFQNAIEPGFQCIVDAAAEANADLTFSSPEFAHPECFIGINPYNYSGDNSSDAIGDAYNCAYAAANEGS